MANLPTVGSDNNAWGTELNSFLQVSHNNDGTLASAAFQTQGDPRYLAKRWILGSIANSGDTTITLTAIPADFPQGDWSGGGSNGPCLVIGAFNSGAEIRTISKIVGSVITLNTALLRTHSVGSEVLQPLDNNFYAMWWDIRPGFMGAGYSGQAAKVNTALVEISSSIGNGYLAKLVFGPHPWIMDNTINIPNTATDIEIDLGQGSLNWTTDLGPGQLAISSGVDIILRDGSIVGPNGSVNLGVDPKCMDGLQVYGSSLIENVTVTQFRNNIRLSRFQHGTLNRVTSNAGFYGVYVTDGDAFFDNQYHTLKCGNNALACFAIASTMKCSDADIFENIHFSATPYGFFAESGAAYMGGTFIRSSFEQIGNAVWYYAAGSNPGMFLRVADSATGIANAGNPYFIPSGTTGYIVNDSGIDGGNFYISGDLSGFNAVNSTFPTFAGKNKIPLAGGHINIKNNQDNIDPSLIWNSYGSGQGEVIEWQTTDFMGSGVLAVAASGTVFKGDLVETTAFQYTATVRPYQTSGIPAFGVSLENSNRHSGTNNGVLIATNGFVRVNVNSANSILDNKFLKPDVSHNGRVVQATDFTDGPIVGVSVAAHSDSITGFGSTRTVEMRLT